MRLLPRPARAAVMLASAALLLSGCASLALYNKLPEYQKVLFASQAKRDAGFRAMEQYGPVATIAAGSAIRALPDGKPLVLAEGLDGYMARQHIAGIIVLQDGKVRLERYGLGFDREGRWTSFSVAKSITSTLVGAALRDGAIRSLEDPIAQYIPELKGSAYDDVTVRQLLTMTSGVKWNENYGDPKSDVARFITQEREGTMDVTVSYMRKLPREVPPGTKWVYKTGETNLVGVLVSKATGKKLSDYLSEKIWKPYGMERDAQWFLDVGGHEISGCCISASLRDYARFGQFMLDGATAGGQPVMADGWMDKATKTQIPFGNSKAGYGFFWWTYGDGSYEARGIFGQNIAIDPARKLVIAVVGNWPKATGPREVAMDRAAMIRSVVAAIDLEKQQAVK
jgi:CubicO group peptidase (beta-lactamase class C family)